LGDELANGRVPLRELGEAQSDLRLQVFVDAREAPVAGADDDSPVEREVGLDHQVPGRTGREPAQARDRVVCAFRHHASSRERTERLRLERRPQLVDLHEVVLGERADEDAPVPRPLEQPAPDEAVERRPQRVPTDVILLGELDLAKVLAGRELARAAARSARLGARPRRFPRTPQGRGTLS
jgi:hypothetical protein